ncbi:MAG: TerB family tellurite resistance protein [Halioglobus sp.]
MAKTQKLTRPPTASNQVQATVKNEVLQNKVQELEQLVALLMVALAKSDAQITQNEEVFQLAGEYFRVRSTASLELLMNAIKHLPEPPDLSNLVTQWDSGLDPADKEDVAVMMLKIVAADGKRDAKQLAMLHKAADMIDITPESLHCAFNRFFDQADKA